MRVVLAPGLALLGEAAASDSPRRHDSGCGGFSSSSLGFGSPPALGLGGWTFRDVPLRPFVFNSALFLLFAPLFLCISFSFSFF
jgi:hypothetical protein